jgi:iron complex outermembrane receptor protein
VPRVSDSDLDTFRFTASLEGSFDVGRQPFDWEVSYLHNSNKLVQTTFGNLNLINTRLAVGPSFLNAATGQVQCGTAAAPIAGCVPFNPFVGLGIAAPGGLEGNQPLRDYLFQEEHATGKTTTEIFAANMSGGLFNLPAANCSSPLGYEHRKEAGKFVPDALAVTGNSTNLAAGPTRGEYTVSEWFAELEIPVLADMRFASS